MKKLEYALDIFKGTCELNNYNLVQIRRLNEKIPAKITLDMIESKHQKAYYYTETFDGKNDFIFGALNRTLPDIYSVGEMINMACKTLYHMEIDEIVITIKSIDFEVDKLIDNLETIDLVVEKSDELPDANQILTFEIYNTSILLAKGGIENDMTFFQICYNDIEPLINIETNEIPLDAYIKPLEESVKNDAFFIASNLKDSGFKTDVDYSLKQIDKEKVNATFLITFDAKDIGNYQVKMVDLATEEVKTVMIDNIIEELAFL